MELRMIKEIEVRRDHICEWCGEIIPYGTMAIRCKGRYNEEWYDWRTHIECYYEGVITNDNLDNEFTPFENERPVRRAGTDIGDEEE